MKSVIVSGGEAPSFELLKSELDSSSLLICADSGANCLYKYNMVPDFLLGDFDSIDKKVLEFFKNRGVEVQSYPSEKNFTDTEAAFYKAVEMESDEIVFLGCTGTRLDHIMGSIGMLKKSLDKGIKAYIKDRNNIIQILHRTSIIKGTKGDTFSLYAYCDKVSNLNIKGARYKLENYDLRLGDSRTVSNEFLSCDVEIAFEDGLLLLFRSHD